MNTPAPTRRPWYREPMVWLVIAFPSASVIGGLTMLWLAVSTFDGLVVDDYYRYGKEINRVLDRDRAAAARGLEGTLDVDQAAQQLRLRLAARGPLEASEILELDLLYATRAGLDQRVRLYRNASGSYYAPLPSLKEGRYRLQLGTERWRLVGSLKVPGDRHAILRAGGPAS